MEERFAQIHLLSELPSDTSQTSSTPAPVPPSQPLSQQRNAAGKALCELKLGNVKVQVSRHFEALESHFLRQAYGVSSREVSDILRVTQVGGGKARIWILFCQCHPSAWDCIIKSRLRARRRIYHLLFPNAQPVSSCVRCLQGKG